MTRPAALLFVLLCSSVAVAAKPAATIALGLTAPQTSRVYRESFKDPGQWRKAPKPRHLVTFAEQHQAIVAEKIWEKEGGWQKAGLTKEKGIGKSLPDILKKTIGGRLDLKIVFNLTGLKLQGKGGACQVDRRFPTPQTKGAADYWTSKGFCSECWTAWELFLVRHPKVLPRVSFFIEDGRGQLERLDRGQLDRLGITPTRVPLLD